MSCDPLPGTGGPLLLVPILVAGIALVVVGALLLVARRSRPAAAAVLLAVVVLGCSSILGLAPAAQATTAGCRATVDSLRVTQTSMLVGLAPGIAPVPIAGIVANDGRDAATVSDVVVSIVAVTRAASSPTGSCDAADYVVAGSRMEVGERVEGGGSIGFAGASIGFAADASDQDGCQRAVVQLLYTVTARGA